MTEDKELAITIKYSGQLMMNTELNYETFHDTHKFKKKKSHSDLLLEFAEIHL